MKILNTIAILMIIGFSQFLVSCKDDDSKVDQPQQNQNEEELITSLILSFSDSAGNADTVYAAFRDPDGDGGDAPIQFDTIRLKENITYNCRVVLLDESKQEIDTISDEVKKEADEHLFCYEINGANVEVTISDSDGVFPLGLETKWLSKTRSNGAARIVLKHQPGVKNGSCDLGETDIDLTFELEIEP